MSLNKVIYKINNEKIKKFQVVNNINTLTFFIVSDFQKLPTDELVRLLINNRKIIIDDNAIIDVDKIYEIKELLNDETCFNNLLISKEAYIRMWFHKEYCELLNELEILNDNNPDLIVKSDIPLNSGIKLKYLETPDLLLKTLDGSLYLKRMVLEKFEKIDFNLKKEFENIINFGYDIKSNLIPSSNIYIEKIAETSNVVCNVLDLNNNFYPEIANLEKYGIISCLDFDDDLVATLDDRDLIHVPYNVKKNYKNIGWIDAVKIKRIIKKQGIRKIILDNIELYDFLSEIKVCTEYGFNRNRTKTYPFINRNDVIIPLYTRFFGWRQNVLEINDPNDVSYELLYFLHELKRILEVDEIVVKLKTLEIAA